MRKYNPRIAKSNPLITVDKLFTFHLQPIHIYLMSDITITIHGGNNQILPNATEAIQNFYVGEYCGETSQEEGDGRSGLMPETIRFRAYINKEEDLERYLAQIVECRTVTELAQVILVMQENELKITPEEMVKERFIRLFLPITPRITKGKSVSNIRARINDAWSSRPRHRSTGRF